MSAPALRLLPAPSTEPQESRPAPALRAVRAPSAWEQERLPLRAPAHPGASVLGRSGGPGDDEGARPDGGAPRWAGAGASELPDPAPLAAALVRAAVEVLGGSRAPSQLLRWLSADVYAALQRRAALTDRVRRQQGGRTRATARTVRVRRVLVSSPRAGVAEAAVCVQDGDRVRAVGLRLEGSGERWRVTALEVG